MIDRYWSAVHILKNIAEKTVEATIPTVFRISRRKTVMILLIIPLAVMAPPKHIAQITNHIVCNIPAIPRVDTKSLMVA